MHPISVVTFGTKELQVVRVKGGVLHGLTVYYPHRDTTPGEYLSALWGYLHHRGMVLKGKTV